MMLCVCECSDEYTSTTVVPVRLAELFCFICVCVFDVLCLICMLGLTFALTYHRHHCCD